MPIIVDPSTRVITIPQSYLTPVSGTLYELDTNQFRLDLKAWEATPEGMANPRTHTHNTEVTVAGTTFARTVEIISGYSVTFENGAYSVRLTGSNNNIFDIQSGILNQNNVQVIPNNSAGLTSPGFNDSARLLLEELHRLQGLDISNPLTVTKTARNAGTISQTISGDGENTTTVQRN